MEDTQKIKVSKFDAARRQLSTAIELWFYDKDPVSIHALVFASSQIVHALHKSRKTGAKLLFDGGSVPDEYKEVFIHAIKKNALFFKHADRDPHAVTEFSPKINEGYLLNTVNEVQALGEQLTAHEDVYLRWMTLHRPELFLASIKEVYKDIPPEGLAYLRSLSKKQFFEECLIAHARKGIV